MKHNRQAFEAIISFPPWIEFDTTTNQYKLTSRAFKSQINREILQSYNRDWALWRQAHQIALEKQASQESAAVVQTCTEVMPGHYDATITPLTKLVKGDKLFLHSEPLGKERIAEVEKDAERYRKLKSLDLTAQTSKTFAISEFEENYWSAYELSPIDLFR